VNIVGLGKAGCQIADNFNEWPQYEVFCVDTENRGYKNFIQIKEQKAHEDYEDSFKDFSVKGINGPTTLFVCGSGNISGMSLRLLEQVKDSELTIFYIKPDVDSLSKEHAMRHKVTFGVLQQYARSSVFSKMFIVDNKSVESILENISIADYWKNINHAISSTYNMIKYFENTEPLLSTFSHIGKTSRIATFSVVNFDTLSEKSFYKLQKPRFKRYFFGVNKETMQDEKDLLHKIREFIKGKTDENTHSSFSIYSTDYDYNYAYSIHYASMIQEENIS
tara:strand:- start:12 stop:845 length:834 start_codon:yes stop_codon:yes gene_type:complete